MARVEWLRFRWNLSKPLIVPPVAPYQVRAALKEEENLCSEVIRTSLVNEPSWSDLLPSLDPLLQEALKAGFRAPEPPCLVLLHGSRVIGVSLLDPDPAARSHLFSGPCVLPEYRNRGLGSLLLGRSLEHLRAIGLPEAAALTRTRSIAARFIYPRFGGVSVPLRKGEPAFPLAAN